VSDIRYESDLCDERQGVNPPLRWLHHTSWHTRTQSPEVRLFTRNIIFVYSLSSDVRWCRRSQVYCSACCCSKKLMSARWLAAAAAAAAMMMYYCLRLVCLHYASSFLFYSPIGRVCCSSVSTNRCSSRLQCTTFPSHITGQQQQQQQH